MRKLLLLLVVFCAGVCFSQSTGDIFSQSVSQQDGVDCSNPAMSGSPQCTGIQSQRPLARPGTDVTNLPLRIPVLTSPEELSPAQYAPNGQPSQNPSQIGRTQVVPKPETEFEQMVADSVGHVLPLFGQSLFVQPPSTFSPVDQMQVPTDYVIGPGDELRIRIWGQVEANLRAVVDRSWQIYIPRVGQIPVAGLHYGDLEESLRRDVSKSFKNFNLAANIGRLRSIQILVVGEARYPGTYTISSLSTLVNAIFASGGPAPQGSLRHIEVRRDGKTISDFDFYDLLIKGDKSKDVRLESGDVLYIPQVGPLVAISGSVNMPAIYEVKDNSTLNDLIDIAGNLSTVADTNKITIDRLVQHHARKTLEFPYDDQSRTEVLKDGDIVRVFSIVPRFVDTVTLRGNVANPGRYPWKPGMRIRDLIPDPQALLTRSYWRDRAAVVSGRATEYPIHIHEPLVVPPESQPYQQQQPYGTMGAPAATGNPQNVNPGAQTYNNVPGYPVQPGAQNPTNAVPAQSMQGYLYTQQQNLPNASRVQPQIEQPVGTAPTLVRDIAEDLRRYAPEINWDYAIIQRVNPVDLTSKLLWLSPRKAIIEHDEASNVELEPGDIVTIFSQLDISLPEGERSRYVVIEGEVARPGVYKLEKNETLHSVLQRAGGLTPNAYVYGSQLLRESARIEQQNSLDQLVNTMEVQVRQSALSIAASVSGGDAQGLAQLQEGIVSQLRSVRASGRVALPVNPNDKKLTDFPDIPMEDDDRLIVPHTPSTVAVVGNVYNPGSFIYDSHTNSGGYLVMAGKGKPQSDLGHAFVLRAN